MMVFMNSSLRSAIKSNIPTGCFTQHNSLMEVNGLDNNQFAIETPAVYTQTDRQTARDSALKRSGGDKRDTERDMASTV